MDFAAKIQKNRGTKASKNDVFVDCIFQRLLEGDWDAFGKLLGRFWEGVGKVLGGFGRIWGFLNNEWADLGHV